MGIGRSANQPKWEWAGAWTGREWESGVRTAVRAERESAVSGKSGGARVGLRGNAPCGPGLSGKSGGARTGLSGSPIRVGIGETADERIASLEAIATVHAKYGHIQEVRNRCFHSWYSEYSHRVL